MSHKQRQRQEPDDDDFDVQLRLFASVAKWIPRAVSPFINIECVFNAGLNGYSAKDYDSRRDFEVDLSVFQQIINLCHDDLEALIEDLRGSDSDRLISLIQPMSKHMHDARAQDTVNLKRRILDFLPLNPDRDVITPPFGDGHKAKRGWNHVWTARFLCPHKDRMTFDQNPHAYMKSVQEGKRKLRAKDLPSFLYQDGAVYDARNPDKGLFRGHVLIRSLRLIYTGESSALSGHRAAARQSQAEMHEMREVTPAALAYACLQVYVNLSALVQWSDRDGYFKFEPFYNIIVGLFPEPRSQWAIDTLAFLTQQLPALKRKVKRRRGVLRDDSDDDSDDGDPTGILAAQAARLSSDNDPHPPAESSSPPSHARQQVAQSSPPRPPPARTSYEHLQHAHSSPLRPPTSVSSLRRSQPLQNSIAPRGPLQTFLAQPPAVAARPPSAPRVSPHQVELDTQSPEYVGEGRGSGIESEEDDSPPKKKRLFNKRGPPVEQEQVPESEEENYPPPTAPSAAPRATRNSTKKNLVTTRKRK